MVEGYSSIVSVKARAKPSVVTSPTSLPPCSKASGIIVSASIVRIAPPANARTNASASGACRVEDGVSQQGCQPADERDKHPKAEDPAALPAAGHQSGRGGDRLGEIREEHRCEHGDTDSGALEEPQPDHRRLGDAVKDDPEHDREGRSRSGGPVHLLAALAAHSVDEQVADEERQGAGREPERDAAVPAEVSKASATSS